MSTDQKVLIVDDSPTIRTNLGRTLKDAGFNVLVAADGEEGLDVVMKNDDMSSHFDVHMPKMDGLEMTNTSRKMALTSQHYSHSGKP